MGEFLYFCIYVVQQLGIMFGVGAQTVLLCMHLAAVHHGEKDNPHANYAHAAHFALGLGLLFIFVSGAVAVGIHALNGELATILSPVFVFKWILILFLTPAFFLYGRVTGSFYYAFTGATWYALFLVHSLGLITTWATLSVLYVLWLLFFSMMWGAFVAVMRWKMVPKALPAPVIVQQKEIPPQVVVVKVETPAPKPVPPPPPPAPKPVPPPPPAPIPTPPPPPVPKPVPPPPPPKPEPLPMSSPFPKIPYVAPKPMASPMPPVPPKPVPPPPPPKPAPTPAPKPPTPIEAPQPTAQPTAVVLSSPKLSFWQRLLAWASGGDAVAAKDERPTLSPVVAPVPPPSKPVVVPVIPTPKPVPPPPPPPPPKPIPPPPPPPAPKPVPPPPPPIPKSEPVPTVVVPEVSKKPSFWSRLFALFARKEKAPQQLLPPPTPVTMPAPAPAPVPPPPPVPKLPPVPPVQKSAPPPPPVIQPLSLPVGIAQENVSYPLPKAAPAAPAPVPPTASETPAETKTSFVQEVIDHMLVPALRIMPQKPEDIAKHNRPPVVKSDDDL